MYAGAWVAPWRVVAEARWLPSPQYLEAASWLAFGSARGAFRSGDPRGLRLHHLSAYEHSVIARYAVDEAMDRVRRVAMAELGACSARPTAPFRPRTLALIPFYGGALDLNGRTGNAHSRQPRAIKLAGLVANACALLAGFASRVVVAACRDAGDRFAVEHALRNFSVSAVDVLELSCALPRMLPFVALDAVQQQYRRRYDFLVYNEADQVFHWDSQRAADNAAAFLSTFPSVVLTPHRWHKRYGSDPDCGGSCGMAITGQNLCHHGTPNVDLRLASRRPGHNNNTPTRWS